MTARMVRVIVGFGLLLGLASAPTVSAAQQSAEPPRIGVLWPVSEEAEKGTLEAFRQGLRELGYREGQNIIVEYRYSNGDDDLLPDLAAELVRLEVDLILTWGVTAARAAKEATAIIPIVNGSMSDPVGTGLVQSLAHPGGNLTGLTSMSRDLAPKRLQLIREIVPGISRLAVLTTAKPTAALQLKDTEAAAQSLAISLQALEVRDPDDFEGAFSAMASKRAEALVVLPDLMFNQNSKRLISLVETHRLPAIYIASEFVHQGGLLSYAPSYPDLFRRAAGYVERVLEGADPAELPIEQASKFEMVINLKAAETLGIAIPPAVLIRADEVIE